MRYFMNYQVRRLVFLKLFKGPLSPALYNVDGNFKDVVPNDYHYRPSNENPFPLWGKGRFMKYCISDTASDEIEKTINAIKKVTGHDDCLKSFLKLRDMNPLEFKFQGIESVEPFSEFTFKKHLGIDWLTVFR